eukprot:6067847-Alexandrium_andersonii.AAC.1
MRNYVRGVEPLGTRLAVLELKGVVPIAVVTAYAPTAMADDGRKDGFYEALGKKLRLLCRKAFVWLGGDFNARVQKRLAEEESM